MHNKDLREPRVHDKFRVLQGWTSGSVMSFWLLVAFVQSMMSVFKECSA